MLIHCVFCAPKPGADLTPAFAVLKALVGEVPGLLSLEYGPNRDFEGKSGRYTEGFVCTFTDRTAHLAYEADPRHQAAGAAIVAGCEGGHDGIMVFDLEV